MDHELLDAGPRYPSGPRHPSGVRRRRWWRAAAALAALAALALVATACAGGTSGPGVAGAGTTTTTSGGASPGSTPKADAVAFSHCMQTHGVPNFPEPNATGQTMIRGGPTSSLNPQSPTFQKAQKDCQKYSPQANQTPAQKAQHQQQLLKFAQCMRAHGISDFPDPSSTGALKISGNSGSGSGIDPSSPQFQAAQKACQHDLPGGKAPGTSTAGPGGGGSGKGGGSVEKIG